MAGRLDFFEGVQGIRNFYVRKHSLYQADCLRKRKGGGIG